MSFSEEALGDIWRGAVIGEQKWKMAVSPVSVSVCVGGWVFKTKEKQKHVDVYSAVCTILICEALT